MAEFIQYQQEHTMPDYEQMRTSNIFKEAEVKDTIKKREEFEYRIAQSKKNIRDFVDYIGYERNLVTLIREKLQSGKAVPNTPVVRSIATRIKKIYNKALALYPHDVRFWDECIKFLQQFNILEEISLVYQKMLKFHGDKADVWNRAIFWEYTENFQEQRVKGLLISALHRHPESLLLYATFISINLENKERVDDEKALLHAETIYSIGKGKFENIDYYLEILNITDKYIYAKKLQDQILTDIKLKFPHSELMWHTLAQRELKGLSQTDIEATVQSSGVQLDKDEDTKTTDDRVSSTSNSELEGETQITDASVASDAAPVPKTLRECIEGTIQIYQVAIKILGTKEIWRLYINAMINLNRDLSTDSNLKRTALDQAFSDANESNNMSEEHYLKYIELLFAKESNAIGTSKPLSCLNVLEKAVTLFPESIKLWTMYIRYHLIQDQFETIQNAFNLARKSLGTDSAPIWQLYLIYLKTTSGEKAKIEADRLINDVANVINPSFDKLKIQIIEMLATAYGIQKARATYELFSKNNPGSYAMHESMIELEANQLIKDPKAQRITFENIVIHFGKKTPSVWLRYLAFELASGEPIRQSQLYHRALQTLEPKFVEEFKTKFADMQTKAALAAQVKVKAVSQGKATLHDAAQVAAQIKTNKSIAQIKSNRRNNKNAVSAKNKSLIKTNKPYSPLMQHKPNPRNDTQSTISNAPDKPRPTKPIRLQSASGTFQETQSPNTS